MKICLFKNTYHHFVDFSKPKAKKLFVAVKIITKSIITLRISDKSKAQWNAAFGKKKVTKVATPTAKQSTPHSTSTTTQQKSLNTPQQPTHHSSSTTKPTKQPAKPTEDNDVKMATAIMAKHPEYKQDHFESALKKASRAAATLIAIDSGHMLFGKLCAGVKVNEAKTKIPRRTFKRAFKAIMEVKNLDPSKMPPGEFQNQKVSRLLGDRVVLFNQESKVSVIGVLEVLGNGSYNTASKAFDLLKGEHRVFREAQPHCTEEELETLVRENTLQKELSKHPELKDDVVKMYNTVYGNGTNASLIEYCDGSLDTGIDGLDRKKTILDLVSIMGRFHKNGYVFADLKPENVLFVKDASGKTKVKLADFGGAFHKDHPPVDGVMTAEYVAPEIYKKASYDGTEYTDRWALGVILYEMKYGKRPNFADDAAMAVKRFQNFTDDDIQAALAIIKDSVANPSSYLDLSDPYDQVINGLLQWKPKKRLSLQEAFEQLEKAPTDSFTQA